MSSSTNKDAGIEHSEGIRALEKVFAQLVSKRDSDEKSVAHLAQIILDQVPFSRECLKDLLKIRPEKGKKALQLLGMIGMTTLGTNHLSAKKLLWKTVICGWKETEGSKTDRDYFADAILNFKPYGNEISTFEAILRENHASRWLVCKLLERAGGGSNLIIVEFMIRSVLRDAKDAGERKMLLNIAHLLVSG